MKFINAAGAWPKFLKIPTIENRIHSLKVAGSNERLAIGAVVLLHLALVIPLAAILNIWIDEAFTLQSTDRGVAYAMQRALGFELQPPLYYIVLTFWRSLNDSVFFARLFSILCTGSTVALAGSLARRYLPGVSPVLVAALVAFNPLTVYAAVEIRFYALVLLFSALLLLSFHDGYVATKPSLPARRWHTAIAVVSLYTNYLLGFLLAAGGIALLLLRRGEVLRKYLVAMIATAILFAPLVVITMQQVRTVETLGVAPMETLMDGVKLIWNTVWQQILPIGENSSLGIIVRWVSRLALPLTLLAILRRRQRPTATLSVLLILVAVVSLFYVGFAIRFGSEFTRPQHTIVLYFPVLLAALALLDYAGGVRAVMVGAVAGLVFAGPYLLETYASLAKQGDWRRVSRYIEEHEVASEPILIFKAEYVLALGYYYTGHNRLIPLPKLTKGEQYTPKDLILQDESDILRALDNKLGATRRFWLVTSFTKPFRGINFHSEILEEFVTYHCAVLRDEVFWKSRVRLLELRSEVGENRAGVQLTPASEEFGNTSQNP